MRADATLDCVGLFCPVPISQTARKLKDIEVGQVLEVVSDDEGIKLDMPAWCKATKNEFLGVEERDGAYYVYVRRLG